MIEPHQFHRDLSLVMINRHHRIKLTALSPDENRIGRMRSIRLDPKLLNLFYRGFDDFAFSYMERLKKEHLTRCCLT